MNIIDSKIKFTGLKNLGTVKRIILHHAEAKNCSVYDIDRWHRNQGWLGIGYHYLVRKDGTVYTGRPNWALGAHTQGHNTGSLGICFEGNFMVENMNEKQVKAGSDLVDYLTKLHGLSKSKDVFQHKHFNVTDCAGKNFPFSKIINGNGSSNNSSNSNNSTSDKNSIIKSYSENGVCTVVTPSGLNIRVSPSTNSEVVGSYSKGEKVRYDKVTLTNGYVWISWIGGTSGKRRYMAVKDRIKNERWGECV